MHATIFIVATLRSTDNMKDFYLSFDKVVCFVEDRALFVSTVGYGNVEDDLPKTNIYIRSIVMAMNVVNGVFFVLNPIAETR